MNYKQQLKARLIDDGWEHAESIEIDEWWAEDCWKIQSVQQSWGLELLVTFLIDPQWDRAHTGERPPVWSIIATESLPETWTVKDPIAQLSMTKRKFEPKLDEFMNAVNGYRDAQDAPTEVLEPWTTEGISVGLVEELQRELAPEHPLHGAQARAVARRDDNDDVLFSIRGGPAPFAVVHLTWSGKPEQTGWPSSTTYKSLGDWKRECMQPDHEEWSAE